jgi:hypothetical protein
MAAPIIAMMATKDHSPGRASLKSGHFGYAAESGSKFRELAVHQHGACIADDNQQDMGRCAKSRRTVLQQDQAMSACRDTVRQTLSKLSDVHQARINPHLAARQ